MTTVELLESAWDPGWPVPLACVLLLVGYGIRYRQEISWRIGVFAVAVGLFFVALASPIGVLARGYLFSAHMLQHLLLTLAVPPLLLLGLPVNRNSMAMDDERRGVGTLASWLAGVSAMWLWHARPLCNAAAQYPAVQAVQTLSLVTMGLAFWMPILRPRHSTRLEPLVAAAYLFVACVACTILGIVVTLSPVEVCTAYLHPEDSLGAMPLLRERWGLSCKADQELGGLLMWVPTCFVYATAIFTTLGRYYAEERPSSVRLQGAP